jgi:hypothetical protein
MLAVAGRAPEGSIGGRSAVTDGRRLLVTTFPWSRKDGGPLMQQTIRTRLRRVTTTTTLANEGRILHKVSKDLWQGQGGARAKH